MGNKSVSKVVVPPSVTPKVYRIKQEGMYLGIPCLHAPFHNRQIWRAVLKLAREYRGYWQGLILMGDMHDLNSLSSYDSGQMPIPGVTLKMENDGANEALDQIERAGKFAKKYALWGNHEARFNKWKRKPDNYKIAEQIQSPTEAMKLHERGYVVLEDWIQDEFLLGDLYISHGESCAKHTAAKHLSDFMVSRAIAHTHRVQVYAEGVHRVYSLGFLGDIDSPVFKYKTKAMRKKWSNGFGVFTLNKGVGHVAPVKVDNRCFIYGGKVYR